MVQQQLMQRQMMKSQRGMTIWSWMFVLGTLGVTALIVMKLAPIYLENMSVKKAVNQVAASSGASSMNKGTVWKNLVKQFYIDEVHSIVEDDVSVEVADDGTKELVVAYEIRKPIMFNVDAVVWFEERVPLKE
ncbi:DUF4845 domain-containing protein [Permianibacter sp. IMCC34836]|uniref:DUF4845 domain-containing protein n=1 Tax=Permianibacter fluminis TaxID=2738515 RepID=UPI001553B33F|nr:DUF4845 domain-containing protein [Permianibacter fluminis]NQD37358.1 DUF4845 domain-containing protein [Permianibacter fluminis]